MNSFQKIAFIGIIFLIILGAVFYLLQTKNIDKSSPTQVVIEKPIMETSQQEVRIPENLQVYQINYDLKVYTFVILGNKFMVTSKGSVINY